MERVGIEPVIQGLSRAGLFKPWAVWNKLPQWPLMRDFDVRPVYVMYDFRQMDRATTVAKNFLASRGINISE